MPLLVTHFGFDARHRLLSLDFSIRGNAFWRRTRFLPSSIGQRLARRWELIE